MSPKVNFKESTGERRNKTNLYTKKKKIRQLMLFRHNKYSVIAAMPTIVRCEKVCVVH
jgi:hypothetical protein